jgi:hypothetical protein
MGNVDPSFDRSSGYEGLSPKSAVGVTVGIIAGSILMFVGVFIFLHQQRKQRSTIQEEPGPDMDERIERETHNYAAVSMSVPQETAKDSGDSGIAALSAERRLPNVEDLDELLVEPGKQS